MTIAWFEFDSSTLTDDGNRFGSNVDDVSMRVNVTEAAGSFAFFETKTRPFDVAAQSVPPSVPRSRAAMLPPLLSPNAAEVSDGPIDWKSPQAPVKSRSLVPNWFVVLQ